MHDRTGQGQAGLHARRVAPDLLLEGRFDAEAGGRFPEARRRSPAGRRARRSRPGCPSRSAGRTAPAWPTRRRSAGGRPRPRRRGRAPNVRISPRSGFERAGDHADGRGLARPVGPEQHGDLALGHRQVQVGQRIDLAEASTERREQLRQEHPRPAHRQVARSTREHPREPGAIDLTSYRCSCSVSTRGCPAAATAACEQVGRAPQAVALGVLRTDQDDPLPKRLADLQVEIRALHRRARAGRGRRRAGVLPGQRAHGHGRRPGQRHRHGRGRRRRLRGRRVLPEPGQAGRRRLRRRRQGAGGADGADAPGPGRPAHAGRRRRRRRPGPVPPRPRPDRSARRWRRDDRLAAGHPARPLAGRRGPRRGGGVGYRVHGRRPPPSPALGEIGDEVFCWVHHHIREDAQTLYGFATRDERVVLRGPARRPRRRPGAGPGHPLGPRPWRPARRSSPTTTSAPSASCPASARRPRPACWSS